MTEADTQLALGGEKLDAALRRCATARTEGNREEVYRALADYDLIVPVLELPEALMGAVSEIETEMFPSVPPITDAQGRRGFPLFTSPKRLEAFAASVGWSAPKKPQLYVALNARFAFTLAFASLAPVVVIDGGGPFLFEGTPEEAASMAKGDVPMLVQAPPPPPPPPPPSAPPPPAPPPPAVAPEPEFASPPEPQALKTHITSIGPAIQALQAKIPDRLGGVVTVLLEQYPAVRMAIPYVHMTGGTAKHILGLAFQNPPKEIPSALVKGLTSTLKRFLPNTDFTIEILSPEVEGMTLRICKPVYVKF
ncbi:MAG TPA: SseB family protein [Planctomycetota bacterium]|nr:SseB family protein [Planctomycetota bacterium]